MNIHERMDDDLDNLMLKYDDLEDPIENTDWGSMVNNKSVNKRAFVNISQMNCDDAKSSDSIDSNACRYSASSDDNIDHDCNDNDDNDKYTHHFIPPLDNHKIPPSTSQINDNKIFQANNHKIFVTDKISDIISEAVSNTLNDNLTIISTIMFELPEVIRTLTHITKLTINETKLENLKNLPLNLKYLNIRDNNISELFSQDIPQSVTHIIANKNKIEILDLSNSPNIEILELTFNPLSIFAIFPPNVQELHINDSDIKTTQSFEPLFKLRVLKMNRTNIESIDSLPDSIEELSICRLTLHEIKKLPKNLRKLIGHSSEIQKLSFEKFPDNVGDLDLYDNKLTSVPEFPNVMSEIDLMSNQLKSIVLPLHFESIDLRKNPDLTLTSEQIESIEIMSKLHQNPDFIRYDRSIGMTRDMTRGITYQNPINSEYYDPPNSHDQYGIIDLFPDVDVNKCHKQSNLEDLTDEPYDIFANNEPNEPNDTIIPRSLFTSKPQSKGFNLSHGFTRANNHGYQGYTGPTYGFHNQISSTTRREYMNMMSFDDGFKPTERFTHQIKHRYKYVL